MSGAGLHALLVFIVPSCLQFLYLPCKVILSVARGAACSMHGFMSPAVRRRSSGLQACMK